MTRNSDTVDKAAPLWAAFVAPLVGAPIMVVLLALAPAGPVEAESEPGAGFAVEFVHGPHIESAEPVGEVR